MATATELKNRIEEKFPNYFVLDITDTLSNSSHSKYTHHIADEPGIILIAKKTPRSGFLFVIMGSPEHEFVILNRDNFLTLKTIDCNLDNTLARMLNNERSCCICFEEISLYATSCEQCGSVSCHSCITKWYDDHGCYDCPICRKPMPVVPIARN